MPFLTCSSLVITRKICPVLPVNKLVETVALGLNSKANPPTLVGGGAWGRRPHTISIPPTKLVVEWRNEKALSKKSTYGLRGQIPLRVLPEISIQGDGWRDQEAIAIHDQRSMRRDGNRNRSRENNGRSRSRMFIGAAEIFSGRSDEARQGKQFGETVSRVSKAEEAVWGTTLLGTRILREHSGSRRGNDQKIYQRTKESRQSTQTLEMIRSHRQSRWLFTRGQLPIFREG